MDIYSSNNLKLLSDEVLLDMLRKTKAVVSFENTAQTGLKV